MELAHKGQKRKSGERYATHPLAVRDILKEKGVDNRTVLDAALLHDILEDTSITREHLEYWFGEHVATIVFYLSKSEKVFWNTDYCRLQSHLNLLEECWREYPEIILIKMADKLHNLRTIDSFRTEKQKRILDETRNVFFPLFEKAREENVLGKFSEVVEELQKDIEKEMEKIEKKLAA